MNKKLVAQLLVLFLCTQFIGLYVGIQLIPLEEVRAVVVTENPEDPINTIALLFYILVMTGFMLLMIAVLKGMLLYYFFKALELLAVFGTSLIVFGVTIPHLLIAFLAALALTASRVIFKKNILLRNVSSVVSVAGVGALIGVSFGVIPVIVFMVLLAAYDLIAVFKTRHMVTLAKAVTKKNLAFTFALPTKKHVFELGTGDMVIPLTFSVSVLHATKAALPLEIRLIPALIVLSASLTGLVWTINYSSKQAGRALPALPPQTVLMLLAYALTYFFGFY